MNKIHTNNIKSHHNCDMHAFTECPR